MEPNTCYHCGDPAGKSPILFDGKSFCCTGCKTVFEILSANELGYYYELQDAAGKRPKEQAGNYDYLDLPAVREKLLEFDNGSYEVVNLYIPNIHCSSCIWVLENLHRLHPAVSQSQVNFPKKTVRIAYSSDKLSLKRLVEILLSIGYPPDISLEQIDRPKKTTDRSLVYKLGLAGFAFGNVMFLSFPEYFDLFTGSDTADYWLETYSTLFRWLMFGFSLPVLLYAGKDYMVSSVKALRKGLMNIDIPIALGLIALFLRSTFDILFNWGPGYFDSFTGLVFFLLLGKFFQQKTYDFLSFERDYKSYFPIAVTRLGKKEKEESVPVYEIAKGDRLLIRHGELIPADGILLSNTALIDYSFVTGEADPVHCKKGDKVYAGGKQHQGVQEMEVLKPVSQSYLTQLWGNEVFRQNKSDSFRRITDRIGKRFTQAVLAVATISAIYWLWADPSQAANVFTAVLIIACPCAIALAAPFTLGNLLRIFGRKKFYLKNTDTLEQMARVNSVIFDKTGTMTSSRQSTFYYEGMELSQEEEALLKNTLRASNHPLSRKLYEMLKEYDIETPDEYYEALGKGIQASRDEQHIRVGASDFVGGAIEDQLQSTTVHISANEAYKGRFVFQNSYRQGVSGVFARLKKMKMAVAVISGDKPGERSRLASLLPAGTMLYFNQKPEDKLRFIESLQSRQNRVMMVGDGLNDAGALARSEVGIAISEDVNVFSPACDGILDASKFQYLPEYIKASKKAMNIIRISFALSLLYNLLGLYFAVTGQLQPIIAAILMPLSSISVVAFTTVCTNLMARKLP